MRRLIFVFGLVLMFSLPAQAQQRGALTNVFASWYTVSTNVTIDLPFKSRDLMIHNGSSVDVCVDLKGGTLTSACDSSDSNQVFQVDGDETVFFQDFVTDSISLGSSAGSASPVSVVVTY